MGLDWITLQWGNVIFDTSESPHVNSTCDPFERKTYFAGILSANSPYSYSLNTPISQPTIQIVNYT